MSAGEPRSSGQPMEFQVSVAFTYIHGERLAESAPPHLSVHVQIQLPSGKPVFEEARILIPFTATVSTEPPVFMISLRGNAIVSGAAERLRELRQELEERRLPQPVFMTAMQVITFEIALLARELGFPPLIPVPPPPPKAPSSRHFSI